jgi:hypothetical protein
MRAAITLSRVTVARTPDFRNVSIFNIKKNPTLLKFHNDYADCHSAEYSSGEKYITEHCYADCHFAKSHSTACYSGDCHFICCVLLVYRVILPRVIFLMWF